MSSSTFNILRYGGTGPEPVGLVIEVLPPFPDVTRRTNLRYAGNKLWHCLISGSEHVAQFDANIVVPQMTIVAPHASFARDLTRPALVYVRDIELVQSALIDFHEWLEAENLKVEEALKLKENTK